MLERFWVWRREGWRAFWRRPGVAVVAAVAVLLAAVSWYLAWLVPPADSLILRYSVYVGANWLAEPGRRYLVPTLATVFVALDLALAYLSGRHSGLLRQAWLWSGVLVAAAALWLSWLLFRINA